MNAYRISFELTLEIINLLSIIDFFYKIDVMKWMLCLRKIIRLLPILKSLTMVEVIHPTYVTEERNFKAVSTINYIK